MDGLGLLLQFVSGIIGGTVAGGLLPRLTMGPGNNALAGLVGGAVGGTVSSRWFEPLPGQMTMDPEAGAGVGLVDGGVLGGALLMLLVGVLQRSLSKA